MCSPRAPPPPRTGHAGAAREPPSPPTPRNRRTRSSAPWGCVMPAGLRGCAVLPARLHAGLRDPAGLSRTRGLGLRAWLRAVGPHARDPRARGAAPVPTPRRGHAWLRRCRRRARPHRGGENPTRKRPRPGLACVQPDPRLAARACVGLGVCVRLGGAAGRPRFVARDPGPDCSPLPGVRGRCALAGGLRRNAKNVLIVPCRASRIRGSRHLGNRSVAPSIAKGFAPHPPGPRVRCGDPEVPGIALKLEQKGPHGNRESSISTAFGTPRERGFCPNDLQKFGLFLQLDRVRAHTPRRVRTIVRPFSCRGKLGELCGALCRQQGKEMTARSKPEMDTRDASL
ncbi:uncharacterized protein LOC116229455 [Phasianus colchicus]|uniref:uncharacterized protein LOC116229455 n=1 Tax=Phasianus colchicus TaxID=9054 RepID=UPI00129EF2F5|nr:uncharacterized protein LOC116229455 [Phasianus colchicus]